MKPRDPETLTLWVALAVVVCMPSMALVIHLLWKFTNP